MPRLPLQGLSPSALSEAVEGVTLTEARRIHSRMMRGLPYDRDLSDVRRASRQRVVAETFEPKLSVAAHEASQLDPFEKWAFRAEDGSIFETVRIPLEREGRFSACVSSQVGCALACAFCATGRLGLKRNLETWEIVEQVRVLRSSLPEGARIHGVVFQGMGEPLANFERVRDAILILGEPSGLAIDTRNITVCTAGLPSGIRRLARELPKVRLGLSVGSAIEETRRTLMPITKAHAFSEIIDAVAEHALETGMAPMFALTPLRGVNDTEAHAKAFGDLMHKFTERTGKRPRVSIIPYNRTDDASDPFSRQLEEEEERFRTQLRAAGVATHWRYSGGADVKAACGQLAATNS